jgi:hypothetical protein
MEQKKQKSTLTTIGIDQTTNRLIDKFCKRYNLKKGEVVRLAFGYLDKASINPSDPPESVKSELAKINKRQDDLIRFIRHTEQEQSDAMERYIREVFIPAYAKNFNKGLDANDILFYGKIHFERERSEKASFMHCHLIVSRKDQSNRVKISPLTNHRNTKKGAIKGGFDRTALFENVEKGFDRLFDYNRQQPETFEYCNTMKNGNLTDKLKMQERELNTELKVADDSTSVRQQVNKSVNQSSGESTNQSFGFDTTGALLSILSSGDNADVENEQQLWKAKKRKQQRRIR